MLLGQAPQGGKLRMCAGPLRDCDALASCKCRTEALSNRQFMRRCSVTQPHSDSDYSDCPNRSQRASGWHTDCKQWQAHICSARTRAVVREEEQGAPTAG